MPELKSFDRVADVYDETRALPAAAEASIADAIVAELRRVANAPRVIEIGIGTGRIAVPLAERGIGVVGLDVSSRMLLRVLEKRSDVPVCLAEASHPPFRERIFDAALFIHVLHLVPDVGATVRASLQLVRRKGVMILGRDEYVGVREAADCAIRDIVREVAGVEMSGGKPYAAVVMRMLDEAGATFNNAKVASWTAQTSAKRHVERLARRDFSSSWEIPDDDLPEVVARATPVLRGIYGGWEANREYPRSFSLTMARLP